MRLLPPFMGPKSTRKKTCRQITKKPKRLKIIERFHVLCQFFLKGGRENREKKKKGLMQHLASFIPSQRERRTPVVLTLCLLPLAPGVYDITFWALHIYFFISHFIIVIIMISTRGPLQMDIEGEKPFCVKCSVLFSPNVCRIRRNLGLERYWS